MNRAKPLLRWGAVAGLLLAVILSGGTAAAGQRQTGTAPRIEVLDVRVVDAKTVDTTFSNPLDPAMTDPSLHVFYADHLDHDTPHVHRATSVVLLDGGRTARVTLDRGLHSENPPCSDELDPRCSDDELDWVVNNARDVYGQTVTDSSWEVWAVGSSHDDDEHDD